MASRRSVGRYSVLRMLASEDIQWYVNSLCRTVLLTARQVRCACTFSHLQAVRREICRDVHLVSWRSVAACTGGVQIRTSMRRLQQTCALTAAGMCLAWWNRLNCANGQRRDLYILSVLFKRLCLCLWRRGMRRSVVYLHRVAHLGRLGNRPCAQFLFS